MSVIVTFVCTRPSTSRERPSSSGAAVDAMEAMDRCGTGAAAERIERVCLLTTPSVLAAEQKRPYKPAGSARCRSEDGDAGCQTLFLSSAFALVFLRVPLLISA